MSSTVQESTGSPTPLIEYDPAAYARHETDTRPLRDVWREWRDSQDTRGLPESERRKFEIVESMLLEHLVAHVDEIDPDRWDLSESERADMLRCIERWKRGSDQPFTIGPFEFHPQCKWVKRGREVYNCLRPSANAALRFIVNQHRRKLAPVTKHDVCRAVLSETRPLEPYCPRTDVGQKVSHYFKNDADLEWIYEHVILVHRAKGLYSVNCGDSATR